MKAFRLKQSCKNARAAIIWQKNDRQKAIPLSFGKRETLAAMLNQRA
jgi:hypothetical protein